MWMMQKLTHRKGCRHGKPYVPPHTRVCGYIHCGYTQSQHFLGLCVEDACSGTGMFSPRVPWI